MASACEQCGRNRVPRLGEITGIADWLETVAAVRRLVLSPVAATALADLPPPEGPVVLLVGPEGGLAPVEVALAERAGFTPLRLGPRVLRTETAVVAALAAIQGRWGDLGRGSGAGGPGGLPVLPPADDGRDNP
jgi:16S rRNA (uracil1498-N3)-methyltransferase